MNQNELSERLWLFAARVGKVVDALPETRLGRHVAGQLVRCGTSAPPNYDESGAAESVSASSRRSRYEAMPAASSNSARRSSGFWASALSTRP